MCRSTRGMWSISSKPDFIAADGGVYKLPRMIEPEPLQQVDRTYVRMGRRKLSYFAGCDYHRLASHPKILAAVELGLNQYGLNVAASRLTTGNHVVYGALEAQLRRFFGAPDALVVSSGYITNLVVAQALRGNFSHALLDARSHSSLADAARFLDCPVVRFNHGDANDLAAAIRRCGPETKLILLTDGMFSHDGSVAPLREYIELLPTDALVLVDDAHGAGVIGRTGRGTLEECGVTRKRIIQTITLSKAVGVFGGAILASREVRRCILDHSHLFVGSTPLPLPLAYAAVQALKLLQADKGFKQRLAKHTAYVKDRLRAAGLGLPITPGPIFSVLPRSRNAVPAVKKALLRAGIYPPYIYYPGGPKSGYFRFVISSEHNRGQLDRLIAALTEIADQLTV